MATHVVDNWIKMYAAPDGVLVAMAPRGSDMAQVEEGLGKLAALGSGRQIADYFEAEHVEGQRASFSHCPVARWMQQQTGIPRVKVVRVAGFVPGAVSSDGMHEGVALPWEVAEFVNEFDRGNYPKVVEAGGPVFVLTEVTDVTFDKLSLDWK